MHSLYDMTVLKAFFENCKHWFIQREIHVRWSSYDKSIKYENGHLGKKME